MTREHCDLCDVVVTSPTELIETDYSTPNTGPLSVRLTFSCASMKPMRLCPLCRAIVMKRVRL